MSTEENQNNQEIIQKETSSGIKIKFKFSKPKEDEDVPVVQKMETPKPKKKRKNEENKLGSSSKKRKIDSIDENEESKENNILSEIPLIVDTLYKEDKTQIFYNPVTDDIVPGYSDVIKKPMDLSKIKSKKYKKIENFFEDVELMLNNAMIFNESKSIFHLEAKRIFKLFQKIKKRIEQENIKKEINEMVNIVEKEEKKSKRTPKKTKIEHDLSGIQIEFLKLIDKLITKDKSKIFHEPISNDFIEYHKMIKKPMDFSTLKQLIKDNNIQHLNEFEENLNLIWSNCFEFNEKESIFYKESEKLQKISQELLKKLELKYESSTPLSTPLSKVSKTPLSKKKQVVKESFPVLENELLKEIMKLFVEKLSKEDTLQIFISPVPKDVPGYYEMIKVPMDFTTMKNKIESNEYKNWDEFEDDFELCFNNAKVFNAKHSIYFQEANKLQRYLQRLRKKCLNMYSTTIEENNFYEKFKESIQNTNTVSTPTHSELKKKLTLSSIIKQLMNDILKIDKKKLFLYPVNTHEVTDYLDVVKEPMDFSTMKTKKYNDLKEFKKDFLLVCGNSKLYNEPFTIYYKEAERIQEIGLEYIKEAEKIEILPEPEEDDDDNDDDDLMDIEDENEDERKYKNKSRRGSNNAGNGSSSDISQRLSFGIHSKKKMTNYSKFQISKIPSIVKNFSESIKELSKNEFLKMENCKIDELYLQLNDQPPKNISDTNEQKYVTSLSNFIESIDLQEKESKNNENSLSSNILKKYGLTNGKDISNQFDQISKFLFLEIKNNEILKDIEKVDGDFDLNSEIKKYLE
eukprot:gene3461-6110_t